MPFQQLGLSPELGLALARLQYTQPTPIQVQAIPVVLQGRDLLACAQTGTGKTAAFALPILDRLLPSGKPARASSRKPRALILVPTRELAAQVHEALRSCGQDKALKSVVIFGGVGIQPQTAALRRGVDVVVATPGRLIDHMRQRNVDLSEVEILVLDEADRLLDMGFLPDLRRILNALPRERQTLLLSATLTDDVKKLAADFTRDPVEVRVTPHNSVTPTVSHQIHRVVDDRKRELLVRLLTEDNHQTLVFCRTKRGADRLCRHLKGAGISSEAIHGDRTQSARTRALDEFKSRRTLVLVATDIAARGLDIDQLPLVVNFDLPSVAEDYIHRIGRTGRAGMKGRAITLVGSNDEEMLRSIQRLISFKIDTAPALPAISGRVAQPAIVTDCDTDDRRSHGFRPTQRPRPIQRPRPVHSSRPGQSYRPGQSRLGQSERSRSGKPEERGRSRSFGPHSVSSGSRSDSPRQRSSQHSAEPVARVQRRGQYEDHPWLANVVC